jgi:hypothetical protein
MNNLLIEFFIFRLFFFGTVLVITATFLYGWEKKVKTTTNDQVRV